MTIYTPANTSELSTALGSATGGDTIRLAASTTYGNITRGTKNYGSTVTIENADEENPATVGYFFLTGVQHLKFLGLTFAPVANSANDGMVHCTSCSNITVEGCNMTGVGAFSGGAGTFTYAGVRFYGGSNILVTGNEIQHVQYCALFIEIDTATVFGNFLHDWYAGDGIHFQSCNDITIEENAIIAPDNELGSDVHYDALQDDHSGTPAYCLNVTARGNFACSHMPGASPARGFWMQSFFLPESAGVVIVEDNVVFGGHLHGVTVGRRSGSPGMQATVRRNTVLQNRWSLSDVANIPQVTMYGDTTGPHICTDNVAAAYDLDDIGGDVTNSNNLTLAYTSYDTHFEGIVHDGSETFDDLQVKAGSSIITNSQGSVYLRGTEYPAGVLLMMGLTPDPDPDPPTAVSVISVAGQPLVVNGVIYGIA